MLAEQLRVVATRPPYFSGMGRRSNVARLQGSERTPY